MIRGSLRGVGVPAGEQPKQDGDGGERADSEQACDRDLRTQQQPVKRED